MTPVTGKPARTESQKWTIDTLQIHLESMIENIKTLVEEKDSRYQAKFDATQAAINAMFEEKDLRYQQRFVAAELAVKDALVAQKEAVAAALAAADRGVTKAEVAAEKRFESVNEFRNTLKDQQAELMPRAEVNVIINSINDKLNLVTARIDKGDGVNHGASVLWGIIIGAAGIVIGVLAVVAAFLKIGH